MKNSTSRRRFVKNAAAGISLLTLPALLSANSKSDKKLKIVCVGGHPDDPESGCGGTLALFAAGGRPWKPAKFLVQSLYLQGKLTVILSWIMHGFKKYRDY